MSDRKPMQLAPGVIGMTMQRGDLLLMVAPGVTVGYEAYVHKVLDEMHFATKFQCLEAKMFDSELAAWNRLEKETLGKTSRDWTVQ